MTPEERRTAARRPVLDARDPAAAQVPETWSVDDQGLRTGQRSALEPERAPDVGEGDRSWCTAAVPPADARAEVLTEVHRYSAEALTAGEVEVFGSSGWCALPDGPAKSHAVVRAALAWWSEQCARAERAADDHVAASHALSAAEDWRGVAHSLHARARTRTPRTDAPESP